VHWGTATSVVLGDGEEGMAPNLQLRLQPVSLKRPANGEKFALPEWARAPSVGAALHVTKDGETLSTLPLDEASYYIMGRAPKVCEEGKGYVIQHPSLSRQHAAVVHGENGTLFIIDLESPCGTWVNKTRLRPYEPHVLENGNILTFGESSRRYVVRLFPQRDRLKPLSKAFERVAGLSFNISESLTDEEDEADEENNNSPNAFMEAQRRKESLRQAKIYGTLNSVVSCPSPKRSELAAATASPAASPIACRKTAGNSPKEQVPSPLSFLSGFSPSNVSRTRPLASSAFSSTSKSPGSGLSLRESLEEIRREGEAESEVRDEFFSERATPPFLTPRLRSNSTSAAIKRRATTQINRGGIQRRRSALGPQRRRVSFSMAKPELIEPKFDDPMELGSQDDNMLPATPPLSRPTRVESDEAMEERSAFSPPGKLHCRAHSDGGFFLIP